VTDKGVKASTAGLGRIEPRRLGIPGDIVERRATPRSNVDLAVTLKVSTVEAAVTSKVLNISRSGLFIATNHPPPIGTVIDVELFLPDGKLLLHGRAEIVRHQLDTSPPGVGARFLDISYEAQELIDRLLEP
jgi:uncharacterized protein (TIGR02266 family)